MPSRDDVRIFVELLAGLILTFVILVVLSSCGGLSDAEKTDLESAARLSAMAYNRADAEVPYAALSRGAYCASAHALSLHGITTPDAGIVCAHTK